MNKAFIFDVDGVLIDTERTWSGREASLLSRMFGKDITDKIGDPVGVSIEVIFEKAKSFGATMDYDVFRRNYDEASVAVYAEAAITDGSDRLVNKLLSVGYKLGLVSSSPRSWVDRVLARLSFSSELDEIVSLHEHEDLKQKPDPAGYIGILRNLDADPNLSIVLEDSNLGIRSGKAAGCYVIGFRGNLVPGYSQTGADAYADTMDDVMRIVAEFDRFSAGPDQ